MRSYVGAFLAMGLLALAGSRLPAQKGPKSGTRSGWLSSLDEGKSQAAKTGKPLMVVFRCEP